MSKTEILSRTIASIALCAAGAAISYLPSGDDLGANNTCISGLVIVIGLAIIWNAIPEIGKIITTLWE